MDNVKLNKNLRNLWFGTITKLVICRGNRLYAPKKQRFYKRMQKNWWWGRLFRGRNIMVLRNAIRNRYLIRITKRKKIREASRTFRAYEK